MWWEWPLKAFVGAILRSFLMSVLDHLPQLNTNQHRRPCHQPGFPSLGLVFLVHLHFPFPRNREKASHLQCLKQLMESTLAESLFFLISEIVRGVCWVCLEVSLRRAVKGCNHSLLAVGSSQSERSTSPSPYSFCLRNLAPGHQTSCAFNISVFILEQRSS